MAWTIEQLEEKGIEVGGCPSCQPNGDWADGWNSYIVDEVCPQCGEHTGIIFGEEPVSED